jgi:hypothetical protein
VSLFEYRVRESDERELCNPINIPGKQSDETPLGVGCSLDSTYPLLVLNDLSLSQLINHLSVGLACSVFVLRKPFYMSALQAGGKRRKLIHSSPPSSDFWDSLSKIWLTKYALRELDQRNAKALLHSTSLARHPQVRRPVTRSVVAASKKSQTPPTF